MLSLVLGLAERSKSRNKPLCGTCEPRARDGQHYAA